VHQIHVLMEEPVLLMEIVLLVNAAVDSVDQDVKDVYFFSFLFFFLFHLTFQFFFLKKSR